MSKVAELERQLAEAKAEENKIQRAKEVEYKAEKEAFVNYTVKEFEELNEALATFKKVTFEKAEYLQNTMFDLFKVEPTDSKSFSITNEKKTRKLTFSKGEVFAFNETAEAGIELLHEVLKNKFEKRNKTMYQIIEKLLSKTKEGDYDPKMLVKLRKFESDINDPNFSKALDILNNAQEVNSTSLYVRAYNKNESGKWIDITLQFSAL
ncbi:MAG: DUF3164 family protein [Flavobacteriales bacterium]